MKVPFNSCYILHKYAYRETSLLLEIFSREHGRISLVAKGARNRKSNQQSLLQIFQRTHISWSMRTELGTLTGIENDGVSRTLTGNWLLAAFYLNELLLRLLHRHESHPEIFDAYDTALTQLMQKHPEQVTLRIFEKYLLNALGYGLVLDHDVITGEAIKAELDYFYRLDSGPTLNVEPGADCVRITGRSLIEFQQNLLKSDTTLREVKHLMQASLKQHLGTKPLASRELYQAFLNNSKIALP